MLVPVQHMQHALTGLCGGRNYSIYLVALSAQLPSPVVGPAVVTLGELQTIQLKLKNSLHFNKCMFFTKFSLPVLYSFTYLDYIYTQLALHRIQHRKYQ